MALSFVVFLSLFWWSTQDAGVLKPDPPKTCESCEAWNRPVEPFRVFGNTYYVGVEGLSSILIASDEGHILLDGGLPQTAPRIDASIRALGFRTQDIRLIVNSHAHHDHAGGIAALARASGAEVAASASGARALEAGEPTPDDPQYALGRAANAFPTVPRVKAVEDGQVLRVGQLAITAHLTPGHTPGSTTWSWKSCEGGQCLDIVYADSLTAVSAPGFRFSGGEGLPSIAERFSASIGLVEQLRCDIVISTHPWATGVLDKLKKSKEQPGSNPFIDRNGCRTYAAAARKRFQQRLAEERK